MLTYRELLKRLQDLDPMRLDDNVTVYDQHEGEYFPATDVLISGADNDVLDEGHLFIKL